MSRALARVPALLALSLCCAGCEAGGGPAIDIELVQDPNIGTEAQVASMIDRVVLVVDSQDGLYGPEAESSGGPVEVRDVDGDPDLELVATLLVERGRLPRIRLERGGLPDRALDLRAFGLRGEGGEEEPLVEGSASGVRIGDGLGSVSMPFNIRPDHLPPRVTDVIPGPGDLVYGCSFEDVVVLFSRPMDQGSLAAPGAIAVDPGGAPLSVRTDASGRVAHLRVRRIEGEGSIAFSVEVSPEVTAIDGQGLDQRPSEPGAQGFSSAATLTCSIGPDLPTTGPCGLVPGGRDCPWPSLLECVDGLCVPATCDGVECPESFVCDPETAFCEIGCEAYDGSGSCG